MDNPNDYNLQSWPLKIHWSRYEGWDCSV